MYLCERVREVRGGGALRYSVQGGLRQVRAGGSGSLCPAINRCHVTVQSARGRAEQPAGYQGRSLLGAEAASRISDQ